MLIPLAPELDSSTFVSPPWKSSARKNVCPATPPPLIPPTTTIVPFLAVLRSTCLKYFLLPNSNLPSPGIPPSGPSIHSVAWSIATVLNTGTSKPALFKAVNTNPEQS